MWCCRLAVFAHPINKVKKAVVSFITESFQTVSFLLLKVLRIYS